jgi:hypothetical protein
MALALCRPVAADPGATAPQQGSDDDPTAVETLLFSTDHMVGVATPVRLEYRFSCNGPSPFSDRVILTVTGEGSRNVVPDYLSDGRHVDFPGVEDAHGNPLLLYFLEHDLREMQRQTQGQTGYFRRVLRRAMGDRGLAIEEGEAPVGGHSVHVRRIVLVPFRGERDAALRYPRIKEKTYEFVLSTDIPGQIVSLATHVTSDDGKEQSARVDWVGTAPL